MDFVTNGLEIKFIWHSYRANQALRLCNNKTAVDLCIPFVLLLLTVAIF